MSYRERVGRKGRAPLRFAFVPAAEVPEGLAEVGLFGDMIAEWLVSLGGFVDDVGYDLRDGWADMVIVSPAGPRLELRMRILADEGATIEGDCQGCGAENTHIRLTMRGDKPVYLCTDCHR